MQQTVYLGIGANLGDQLSTFKKAITLLREKGIIVCRTASIYQSEPWGFESVNIFYNTVFECTTVLSPMALLAQTQQIEMELGRTAKTGFTYESRLIDIDILFFENEVINNSQLQIPHPLIGARNFVLAPLNELIPTFIHPNDTRSISTLLKVSNDRSKVFIVDNPLLVNQ